MHSIVKKVEGLNNNDLNQVIMKKLRIKDKIVWNSDWWTKLQIIILII